MTADMAAAVEDIKGSARLGVVGFCMGGTAVFLAACRVPGLSAAVSIYGGMIAKFADEKPKCPLQMHFGEKDENIPLSIVEKIKAKLPHAETYVIPMRRMALLRRARGFPQGRGRSRVVADQRILGEEYEIVARRASLSNGQARPSAGPFSC